MDITQLHIAQQAVTVLCKEVLQEVDQLLDTSPDKLPEDDSKYLLGRTT